jgi:TatD DNase family protein
MLTDAHCHPFDLAVFAPRAEEERRRLGAACAASSWNGGQYDYIEDLALKAAADNAPPLLRCFAVHPQLPSAGRAELIRKELLPLLDSLAAGGRLDAVGETGFDLFDASFRAAEKLQDECFAVHLETALRYGLPLVLHVRRAMHKIFPFAKELKKLPAVIFHSWPGTAGEGEALVRRGINVFFSFGAILANNHKEARRCCAAFPLDRILTETDAPFQPFRGKKFSSWEDLPVTCAVIAGLRNGAGGPPWGASRIEEAAAANFARAFSPGRF